MTRAIVPHILNSVTRRDLLHAAAAAALPARTLLAKASQPATPLNFPIPPQACDCHTHIIGDPKQFPFSPGRTYTPEAALPDEMSALHRTLHMERVVIVTPSVYGPDNAATLYGMKARGATARGVAVIDEKTSAPYLDAMNRAGIRGIRLNLASAGQTDLTLARRAFTDAIGRVASLKWHIQMYTDLSVIAGIRQLVETTPVPVVFDHFGGAQAARGSQQPGFSELLALVHSGKAWVKISGAYRASAIAPDYPDVLPLAKALIAANPDRIIWGSDWPHPGPAVGKATDFAPFQPIDDGRLLNQLAVWAPDPVVRKKILVENPARLYGF